MHKGFIYIFSSLICITCSHFCLLKPTTSTFTMFSKAFPLSFYGSYYSNKVFDILRLRKI